MKFQNVLILSPHTDDAELGCGGVIARLLEQGADVHVAAFSQAEDSLPADSPRDLLKREFFQSMSVLRVPQRNCRVFSYPVRIFPEFRQEVLEDLLKLKREIRPELVLLPSGSDIHQDHQVVHQEGLRAFKEVSLLGYELPWNNCAFAAQAFVTLEERHVCQKWQALQAYESQLRLGRSYFSEDFVRGLAKMRGTQIKSEWAEAFEVLRVVL